MGRVTYGKSSAYAPGCITEKPRPNAAIHDVRHSFGVAAAQAGVPIVRLQKLLDHTRSYMTMRYLKHAPEAYFKEDAAKVTNAWRAKVLLEVCPAECLERREGGAKSPQKSPQRPRRVPSRVRWRLGNYCLHIKLRPREG